MHHMQYVMYMHILAKMHPPCHAKVLHKVCMRKRSMGEVSSRCALFYIMPTLINPCPPPHTHTPTPDIVHLPIQCRHSSTPAPPPPPPPPTYTPTPTPDIVHLPIHFNLLVKICDLFCIENISLKNLIMTHPALYIKTYFRIH